MENPDHRPKPVLSLISVPYIVVAHEPRLRVSDPPAWKVSHGGIVSIVWEGLAKLVFASPAPALRARLLKSY